MAGHCGSGVAAAGADGRYGNGRRAMCRRMMVVVVVVTLMLGGEVGGKVRLVDQGYEGVVIAISPYIAQDNAILHRLQKYLTETSKTLFRATRKQLYFREFVIVIPRSWKGISNVKNTMDSPMDFAQFIIDQPNKAYGDAPYVKQYAECGQPGLYIHLTPNYLLDDDVINKWGPPGLYIHLTPNYLLDDDVINKWGPPGLYIHLTPNYLLDDDVINKWGPPGLYIHLTPNYLLDDDVINKWGPPGLYIHLTPNYLLDDDVINKWGPPEKTLVHEWAHLRWGLFDEYPIDPQDAEFYQHNGAWHPTRCTTEVDGSIHNKRTSKHCVFDYKTGKPEANCLFFPRIKSNKASASLMFMQYLDSIVEFCDDPVTSSKPVRHNNLAPNRQNRLCAYRSAWEVMRKHEDFRKVTPLADDMDTTPKFRFVQFKPKKRVLVLDTSGSMTGSSLSVMMQATSSYILSCIETGSSLGIVQFNTNATVLSPMVPIHSEDDRHKLIRRLPRQAEGKTSIGAGLEKGLQLLNSVKNKKDDGQGSIILITDGKENERPFLNDFQAKILSKGVVVHSLAYGQRAELSIAQLSRRTGGKLFFYSGRRDSTALIDGLSATVKNEGSSVPADVPVSILTEARTAFSPSPLTGSFIIDPSVGRETSIIVSYSHRVTVRVISPSDVTMTSESHRSQFFRDDEASGVVKIMLPGSAEVGKWTYVIATNESQADITVNVQSKSRKPETEVLQATSWLSWLPENNTVQFDPKQKITIFAELIQGRSPVLNADVTAVLERPQSAPLRVPLHDNGMGSDIIRDDGVYAAYVLAGDMRGNGRYNIKLMARGMEGVTQLVVGGKGGFSGALEVTSSGTHRELVTETLGEFERVTSPGEFRVTGIPEDDRKGEGEGEVGKGKEEWEDWMAPSRITDLHVLRLDPDSGHALLRWTSVGDDMDRGTASSYVLQISGRFDDLFTRSAKDTVWTELDGDWTLHASTPQAAGQTEQADLRLRRLAENSTLYLGLRAVDDSGNTGELSNVVTLSRAKVVAVPIEGASSPGDRSVDFYIQLLVPPLAALLLFLAIAVLVTLAARRRRSSGRKGKFSSSVAGVEAGSSRVSSASTLAVDLDLSFMNYRHEGAYRLRHAESPETWSELSKSPESM